MNPSQAVQAAPETATLESRRRLLGKFASAVFAGLVAPAVLQLGQENTVQAAEAPSGGEVSAPPTPPRPNGSGVKPISGEASVVDAMLADLQRALEKRSRGEPVRFGMAVDLKKCTG
ncbi:MAG: hypothetical protein D6796_16870, partial [Caldilineae bacterium]